MRTLSFLVLCFCVSLSAAQKRKARRVVLPPPPPPVPVERQSKPQYQRGLAETPVGRISRFKLVNFLGVNAVSGAGLITGGQFGYAPNPAMKFYWGPEMDFTLFPQGTLLNLLASFWYEWRCLGAENLAIHLGALAGAGFAHEIPGFPSTNLVAFVDAALATELDDLVTLRGQLRPGYVGNHFAFMVNFNVMFRFY